MSCYVWNDKLIHLFRVADNTMLILPSAVNVSPKTGRTPPRGLRLLDQAHSLRCCLYHSSDMTAVKRGATADRSLTELAIYNLTRTELLGVVCDIGTILPSGK